MFVLLPDRGFLGLCELADRWTKEPSRECSRECPIERSLSWSVLVLARGILESDEIRLVICCALIGRTPFLYNCDGEDKFFELEFEFFPERDE